jgi:hypothetical protein
MKNIYEVLRQKEAELALLQKEIEALQIAARLLNEEPDGRAEQMARPMAMASAAASGPMIAPVRPNPAREPAAPWDAGLRQFP